MKPNSLTKTVDTIGVLEDVAEKLCKRAEVLRAEISAGLKVGEKLTGEAFEALKMKRKPYVRPECKVKGWVCLVVKKI